MSTQARKLAFAAVAACGLMLLAQAPAAAQMPYYSWQVGGQSYSDSWGNHYWVSPGRTNPWSNIVQPGTYYSSQFYLAGRGWGYREHWIDPYGVPRSNWVYPGPYGRGTYRYHTRVRR
jgi:hypothetical protein